MSTILVTGATDGIGLETALDLAGQEHVVILHGRSSDKLSAATSKIQRVVPEAELYTVRADFADLSSVAAMAKDMQEHLPRLDVLVNNAGVYMTERQLSKDGFEMTLAVNHLAHFLLTSLLLPLLKKATDPRVVTVSSIAHNQGRIDFEDMDSAHHFDGYTAYATSKLANTLFANELARREPWLCSNSLHPGVIDTKLLHTGFNMQGASVASGAQTSVFLASSPKVKGLSGLYFDNRKPAPVAVTAADEELAGELWRWSENAVRPYLGK
jgi:NAD(P)-dependent dehydrogenase (short-subunit alcohol dehydrogenase family)